MPGVKAVITGKDLAIPQVKLAIGEAAIDLADMGLKDDYIAAVTGRLLPGHAALVAEGDEYSTQPVDEAVWRHGGVIFRHPMTDLTV